jgi:hypothetical protein
MKIIILLLCCAVITSTAFTQIKSSGSMIKSNTSVREKTALVALTTGNRDSVEISQLFEAFKIADAEATNKLQMLIEKVKIVNAKNADKLDDNAKANREMGMVQLQSLVSQRGTMLQMITNMMKSIDDALKSIVQNIR